MKALRIVSLLMVVIMLSVSVAAASFFTVNDKLVSSVEYKNATTLVSAVDANGNAMKMTLSYAGLDDIKSELAGMTLTSISSFKSKWNAVTGKAPVETAAIADVFALSLEDATVTYEKIQITLEPKNVAPGEGIVVIHKYNGKWKHENASAYKIGDDGKVTITLAKAKDGVATIAIVKNSGLGPQGLNAPTSPNTAEIATSVLPVIAVVAAMGVAVIAVSKKRASAK